MKRKNSKKTSEYNALTFERQTSVLNVKIKEKKGKKANSFFAFFFFSKSFVCTSALFFYLVDFANLAPGDVFVIVDQTSKMALPNDQVYNNPTATLVTFTSDADKTEFTASAVTDNLKWVVTNNGDGFCSFTSNSDASNMLYMINVSQGMSVGPAPSKSWTNAFIF